MKRKQTTGEEAMVQSKNPHKKGLGGGPGAQTGSSPGEFE